MARVAAQPGRWRSLPVWRRIAIIVVAVVLVLALAAWVATIVLRPHAPSPAAITQAMQQQAALTGGEKVYVTHCAYCHDTGFGPAIAGLGLPPDAVRMFVRSGPAIMPAFPPSQVTDADIAAVTAYINRLPPHPAPAK